MNFDTENDVREYCNNYAKTKGLDVQDYYNNYHLWIYLEQESFDFSTSSSSINPSLTTPQPYGTFEVRFSSLCF
jgi:hypothetical protein